MVKMMHPIKRVLIISNNTLSMTSNNGKTILSLFEEYPKDNLFQLFTREETPTIKIGGYFRITNKDVVRGRFSSQKRGSIVVPNIENDNGSVQLVKPSKLKRTSFSCLVREMLWTGAWRSKQLDAWLDEINPEIIFFVAGDTGYSYSICEYVAAKTGASVNIYITDDYVLPRSKETIFDTIKRKNTYKKLTRALEKTDSLFTISEKMRQEYESLFHKDSMPIFNVSDDLRIQNYSGDSSTITVVYAGSLYYGRYNLVCEVAKCISKLNKNNDTNLYLEIYAGQDVSNEVKAQLTIKGASVFGGALNKPDLIRKLNEADILLFVESFEKEQIEKTKLSLSTKISEYMSVEKPILAIGPREIGSMEFLNDVALCIDRVDKIKDALMLLNNNENVRNEYALKAREKFEQLGDTHIIRERFIKRLCGM